MTDDITMWIPLRLWRWEGCLVALTLEEKKVEHCIVVVPPVWMTGRCAREPGGAGK